VPEASEGLEDGSWEIVGYSDAQIFGQEAGDRRWNTEVRDGRADRGRKVREPCFGVAKWHKRWGGQQQGVSYCPLASTRHEWRLSLFAFAVM